MVQSSSLCSYGAAEGVLSGGMAGPGVCVRTARGDPGCTSIWKTRPTPRDAQKTQGWENLNGVSDGSQGQSQK